MTDAQYEDFTKHREAFTEAFKDADEAKLNKVLDELPENQVEADEYNEARRLVDWKDCSLKMTAGYYANNKVMGEEFPVPDIDELKALLDAAEEEA